MDNGRPYLDRGPLDLDKRYIYSCSMYADISVAECAQGGEHCQFCEQWETINRTHVIEHAQFTCDLLTQYFAET